VAYGQGSGANGGGSCPSTHAVKLPQIMYEVMWDVSKFADKSLWPTDGSDPFVYSMNIGGAAAHGDYVFGWEADSLQKAMDNNCNLNSACPKAGLTVQTPAQYGACKKKQQAPEQVDGCKCSNMMVSVAMLIRCVKGSSQCRLGTKRSRLRTLACMGHAGLRMGCEAEVASIDVVYRHSLESVWILDSEPCETYADYLLEPRDMFISR
jgi:hypothetical protein